MENFFSTIFNMLAIANEMKMIIRIESIFSLLATNNKW
jgi:hypothetical protein